MPYTPIANLSRRGEKIAPFITVQNLAGAGVLGFATAILLVAAPPLLRIGCSVLMGLVGYAITMEWQGMSVVGRLLWLVRGAINSALRGGRPISPSELLLGATSGELVVLEYGGAVSLLGEEALDIEMWGLPRLDDDDTADEEPHRPAWAA